MGGRVPMVVRRTHGGVGGVGAAGAVRCIDAAKPHRGGAGNHPHPTGLPRSGRQRCRSRHAAESSRWTAREYPPSQADVAAGRVASRHPRARSGGEGRAQCRRGASISTQAWQVGASRPRTTPMGTPNWVRCLAYSRLGPTGGGRVRGLGGGGRPRCGYLVTDHAVSAWACRRSSGTCSRPICELPPFASPVREHRAPLLKSNSGINGGPCARPCQAAPTAPARPAEVSRTRRLRLWM